MLLFYKTKNHVVVDVESVAESVAQLYSAISRVQLVEGG